MEIQTRSHLGEGVRARAFRKPMSGCNVWPGQHCPAFTVRTVGLACGTGCWFCRYANFHLTQPVSLEVGVCCWPERQSD